MKIYVPITQHENYVVEKLHLKNVTHNRFKYRTPAKMRVHISVKL